MVLADIAHVAQIDVSACDVTQLAALQGPLRDTWYSHLAHGQKLFIKDIKKAVGHFIP